MELGPWDAATVLAKTIVYAATFGSAGGIFFLRYSDDLITDAQRAHIQKIIRVFVVVALLATVARVSVLAGSMGESVAALFNGSFIQMIVQAGEGSAAALRTAGLLVAAYALFFQRRPGALAIAGAAVSASSFAWVGHPRAVGVLWAPLLEGVHLVCV